MAEKTTPVRVPILHCGRGSLSQLKTFKENRIFVVTDKIARKLAGDTLLNVFQGKEVAFFDEVEPEPKDSIMNKSAELARGFKPELIVGIGGGSVMDTAKAAYFLFGQPSLKLADLNLAGKYDLQSKCKLVLVPTTSGTGSESSAGLVYTDTVTGKKTGASSFELVPWGIVVDPTLAVTMPQKLTISSGLDALAQAIESASSVFFSDFLQAYNLYGIKSILAYLPLAAHEGANDIAVREKIHYAASMIGIAMGNTGLGVGHACGHAIGGAFGLAHGLSVGVMLPYCIEYNKPHAKDSYVQILESLNVTGVDDPAAKLSSMVKEFLTKLGVPTTIGALGVSRQDWEQGFDKVVKFAASDFCLFTNPRKTGEAEIRKILQYAYEGKTVDF